MWTGKAFCVTSTQYDEHARAIFFIGFLFDARCRQHHKCNPFQWLDTRMLYFVRWVCNSKYDGHFLAKKRIHRLSARTNTWSNLLMHGQTTGLPRTIVEMKNINLLISLRMLVKKADRFQAIRLNNVNPSAFADQTNVCNVSFISSARTRAHTSGPLEFHWNKSEWRQQSCGKIRLNRKFGRVFPKCAHARHDGDNIFCSRSFLSTSTKIHVQMDIIECGDHVHWNSVIFGCAYNLAGPNRCFVLLRSHIVQNKTRKWAVRTGDLWHWFS